MFAHIFYPNGLNIVTVIGVAFVFLSCFYVFYKNHSFLPGDGGTDVTGGHISRGKPTGAGIVFILAFDAAVLLFCNFSVEIFIYILLISAEMIAGYMDDRSKVEWGRLKKGLFDFAVAVAFAITYLVCNPSTFVLAVNNYTVHIHPFLYAILIIILVWGSINVTNCADGVDGLSGTLSCITLLSMLVIMNEFDIDAPFRTAVLFMVVGIVTYLFFNTHPSKLMMGDAGSRAIGLFIAICAVKSHHPLLYLLLALVLMVDGGLGLIKITMIKLRHNPDFMSGIRTPVHDQFRKVIKWTDTQVVARFALFQIIICLGVVFYVCR